MRINTIRLQNFKKYADQTLTLDPHFTLLIGPNASGKTTFLDGLAVSMAIWLAKVPDSSLANSRRNILSTEIRLERVVVGDRSQFAERQPVMVTATGALGDGIPLTWTRQIKEGGQRTSNAGAKDALRQIEAMYDADAAGDRRTLPVLAYYGAGRAWLPSNERVPSEGRGTGPARRWAAFYDCFNERIRFDELRRWFHVETTAAGNRGGRMRPGFEVVKRAVLSCVPGADDLWFDADRMQIVFSVEGAPQPFDNLSAGQRMMMALVADIAIKAVTQNAHLLPPDVLGPDDEPLSRVLRETPGMVLIDELDVHLHPSWQRRVAADLKRTFPAIQFVCTSHSPQVIGEVAPHEIRALEDDLVSVPPRSFGIDSNRVLEEVMDAPSRSESVTALLRRLFELIDAEDFEAARKVLPDAEDKLGTNDPEILRARTLIAFLEDTR